MCLRKVVRLSFVRRYMPVPLTDVGVATRGIGAKPGACEGKKRENRERMEGTAPRRLSLLILNIRIRTSPSVPALATCSTNIYHASYTFAVQ